MALEAEQFLARARVPDPRRAVGLRGGHAVPVGAELDAEQPGEGAHDPRGLDRLVESLLGLFQHIAVDRAGGLHRLQREEDGSLGVFVEACSRGGGQFAG